jgi:hypothetical protein
LFNDSRHQSLHDVLSARRSELERSGHLPRLVGGHAEDLVDSIEAGFEEARTLLAAGRLLVWQRDDTIDDGAGEAETGGYLDESDMPPWDTWVAYVDVESCSPYLVSWVPRQFLACIGRAIDCNAYGALYWLQGTNLMLTRVLDEDGLLV